jgi:hypothetical protein
MAMYRLMQNLAFGADDIKRPGDTYEEVLRALGLVNCNNPVTELVAKKTVEVGQSRVQTSAEIAAAVIAEVTPHRVLTNELHQSMSACPPAVTQEWTLPDFREGQ